MIGIDLGVISGRYRRAMVENFDWREIGRVRLGPRLSSPESIAELYRYARSCQKCAMGNQEGTKTKLRCIKEANGSNDDD
jgi:hypothetical protein